MHEDLNSVISSDGTVPPPIPEGEESELSQALVPWTIRDVWFGVAFLVVWMAASFAFFFLWWRTDLDVGLVIGAAELALLLPVWWLAVRRYGVGWGTLGLRSFRGTYLGLGCVLIIGIYTFTCGYASILARFSLRPSAGLVPLVQSIDSPWWLLIAGVVVAPVVEEIFFRGFVFAGLREQYGWQRAAVISSLVFALIHLEPLSIVPIFGIGLAFAYIYHRSSSVWPAVMMHVFLNLVGLGATFVLANMDYGL